MKNILITGKNSYIGTSFLNWIKNDVERYNIETITLKDGSWKNKDFSKYDVIFHVAGIAHSPSSKNANELYMKINRDLTIEVADKARRAGVKQFIFISSIIVYGNSSDKIEIDFDTIPTPNNIYGKSKLLAEKGIADLETEHFKIVILRPPMVYGRGSKGNYQRLATLAKKVWIFPDFKNERSMLHIDNLCELVKIIIDQEKRGIYFPQNEEYVSTVGLVKAIALVNGSPVKTTKIFNALIENSFRIDIIKKAFGSLVYKKSMSNYEGINYRVRTFKESIELSESK